MKAHDEARPLLVQKVSSISDPETQSEISDATSLQGDTSPDHTPQKQIVNCNADVDTGSNVTRSIPPYIASLSPQERRRAEQALVRRIDRRLIPPIIVMYILNYIDRTGIASARLGGLEDDLYLQGSQYQTAVSVLFVGYISMQVPSNLLMNRLRRPSIYLPVCMIIWGIISACTGAVQTYSGLITVRFILGFAESPFFPGALFLLSSFYTRKELAFRTAMLYSGSLISGAFAGVLAAGIMKMDGLAGLRAWRWLFIVEGTVTVLVSFACIFILPDMPKTTAWLTPEQRELASWRLDEDIGQENHTDSKTQGFFHGLILSINDPKVWIMAVLLFSMVLSSSVTNYFPTIVQTLGFPPIESLLLTAPPYTLAVLTCYLNAWHSDRGGEKYLHVTLPLLLGIVFFILAATTNDTTPRYIAMTLMIPGCYTGYVIALGWISSTFPRPRGKRAASLALVNAISNTAPIFSSYLFPGSAGPGYKVAFTVCGISAVVAVFTASVLRGVLVRLNGRLERGEVVRGVVGGAVRGGFRFLV